MREFVNFAQDAVANGAKNTIARLGKQETRVSAFSIRASADGDSVGKMLRSDSSKKANNSVRSKFRQTVADMFGGADRIPPAVRTAMSMKVYEKGKPLTADRILDVYAAIKNHNSGLMNEALGSGTLRALDVADTVADRFVEKFFTAKCKTPPSAAVVSNLKRALLLCAANILDDNAVKGGEQAVRNFVHPLKDSFSYTLKALGFDTATHKVSMKRVENLMKDELHMRQAVFALLDKDGNVDVNNFDTRLRIFDDKVLKRGDVAILRPNLDAPGPEAVKSLQAAFVLQARIKVADVARDEINAFFEANPDRIPEALRPEANRNDKHPAESYVQLVSHFIVSKGGDEAAARLAYGDTEAKIDVAAELRKFNEFMDSIYAATNGDQDLRTLVGQFVERIAFNGVNQMRSLDEIKKKFIEPVRANFEELRALAGGNAAIVKAGVDALAHGQMDPFRKGTFTKLANAAKAVDLSGLNALSDRSTPFEIAKTFLGLFPHFEESMDANDYVDPLSRIERNAYSAFFAGVVMSRLDQDAKDRMVTIFAGKAAWTASNILQTVVASNTLSQKETTNLQEGANMMRLCSTFIADEISFNADDFPINEVDITMKVDSLSDEVIEQYGNLAKGMEE